MTATLAKLHGAERRACVRICPADCCAGTAPSCRCAHLQLFGWCTIPLARRARARRGRARSRSRELRSAWLTPGCRPKDREVGRPPARGSNSAVPCHGTFRSHRRASLRALPMPCIARACSRGGPDLVRNEPTVGRQGLRSALAETHAPRSGRHRPDADRTGRHGPKIDRPGPNVAENVGWAKFNTTGAIFARAPIREAKVVAPSQELAPVALRTLGCSLADPQLWPAIGPNLVKLGPTLTDGPHVVEVCAHLAQIDPNSADSEQIWPDSAEIQKRFVNVPA